MQCVEEGHCMEHEKEQCSNTGHQEHPSIIDVGAIIPHVSLSLPLPWRVCPSSMVSIPANCRLLDHHTAGCHSAHHDTIRGPTTPTGALSSGIWTCRIPDIY